MHRSWGELKPTRNCTCEARGACLSLLVPRFGGGRFGRLMDRWLRLGPVRVKLDKIGTFVWSRCDGTRTAAEIAQAMRVELGQRTEPTEQRLELFLKRLLRAKFITVDGSLEQEVGEGD